jgi:hypothetical protein
MEASSIRDFMIWFIVPFTAFMIPFIPRFLLHQVGLWYFHSNFSIAFVIAYLSLASLITKEGVESKVGLFLF